VESVITLVDDIGKLADCNLLALNCLISQDFFIFTTMMTTTMTTPTIAPIIINSDGSKPSGVADVVVVVVVPIVEVGGVVFSVVVVPIVEVGGVVFSVVVESSRTSTITVSLMLKPLASYRTIV